MTDQTRILIVEDEEDIQELIRYHLEAMGHATRSVLSGESALPEVASFKPDLILLDIMLPRLDGLSICRKLKSAPETSPIPVILVSARGEESDVVRGLELGAEDYITKPFSINILKARVQTALRRSGKTPALDQNIITAGKFRIDCGHHEVTVGGVPVALTVSEFNALVLLAGKPGWVFTRSQIVKKIKGEDYPVTDRSVDVLMVGLRKKLGKSGKIISTVRGIGYRLKAES